MHIRQEENDQVIKYSETYWWRRDIFPPLLCFFPSEVMSIMYPLLASLCYEFRSRKQARNPLILPFSLSWIWGFCRKWSKGPALVLGIRSGSWKTAADRAAVTYLLLDSLGFLMMTLLFALSFGREKNLFPPLIRERRYCQDSVEITKFWAGLKRSRERSDISFQSVTGDVGVYLLECWCENYA